MKQLFVVLLLAGGCPQRGGSSHHHADLQSQVAGTVTVALKFLPRLYWPLDYTRQQRQINVAGSLPYRVVVTTTCVNDSAVINSIALDAGPALDISRNYVSDLLILENGRDWQQVRLTKAIFQGNTATLVPGPLSSLAPFIYLFLRL